MDAAETGHLVFTSSRQQRRKFIDTLARYECSQLQIELNPAWRPVPNGYCAKSVQHAARSTR